MGTPDTKKKESWWKRYLDARKKEEEERQATVVGVNSVYYEERWDAPPVSQPNVEPLMLGSCQWKECETQAVSVYNRFWLWRGYNVCERHSKSVFRRRLATGIYVFLVVEVIVKLVMMFTGLSLVYGIIVHRRLPKKVKCHWSGFWEFKFIW
jgi:hypothetical protein